MRHDRIDNFWFTLAYELAHLVLGHVAGAEGQCIIDDLDIQNHKDAQENEADKLAAESLIPQELWESHPARDTAKLPATLDLAIKTDVNIAVVAGRIRRERDDYKMYPTAVTGLVYNRITSLTTSSRPLFPVEPISK